MDAANPYYRQVKLLMRVLPLIASEKIFALKGGTAINLFIRDMPRLSVDIDLVYLPIEERTEALSNTTNALMRIADTIAARLPGTTLIKSFEDKKDALRLFVAQGQERIKIELSPVLRGSVFQVEERDVSSFVEEEFGYARMQVLSLPDPYAGKICAALDRQHPRDLFDVKLLLENEGMSSDLIRTFLVYLISHNRTMAEILSPVRKDIKRLYEGEFSTMSRVEVNIEELFNVRERLIYEINRALTDDQKTFLLSFKAGSPEWRLLGIAHAVDLPAVRWKLKNLQNMTEGSREKAYAALEIILNKSSGW